MWSADAHVHACTPAERTLVIWRSFSTPFSADPLPLRHLAGMDRKCMAEELLTAEELPVEVLDPPRHHLLVREIEGVLEELKARHQPRGDRRTAVVGAIHGTELGGDGLPS